MQQVTAGDVYENPVTGERVVVRVGNDTHDGRRVITDLYVGIGGGVLNAHTHPGIDETFTVVSGQVMFLADGVETVVGPGTATTIRRGVSHAWWNAEETEAHVIVELYGEPGDISSFVTMIGNLFGLGRAGKLDTRGRPGLLQTSLLAREFDDVIRFDSPPRPIQKLLFGTLAPIARLRGYRSVDPECGPSGSTVVEPWPTPTATLSLGRPHRRH